MAKKKPTKRQTPQQREIAALKARVKELESWVKATTPRSWTITATAPGWHVPVKNKAIKKRK